MPQEVSTVEQQRPQTQGQRTPQAQGQHPPQPQGNAERNISRPVFVPPTDIYETADNLIVMCELPGVGSDGVDITLERRVLTIRGRAATQHHAGYQRVYAEYADGDYERVFTLSEDIDRDRIEATARDGVLHLVLPKAAPAKARRIELKTT
ncbi:MAG TPA: Hsp20/alpha crystallin family protein [Stellaceae bacterium]|nr:Hsp20/alpha crystallin family protein [Stellaceae bacterium]